MKALVTIILFACSLGSFAATSDWQQNRVIPLSNITVGPWDNFEATINSDDSFIYYTRDQNQVSNIYRQNLETFDNEQFIGKDGDAKQPVLNDRGDNLAITYFQYDAQGDVCLVKLPEKSIECITDSKTVDESPFWVDSNNLGFISRETAQLNWMLRIYNLQSKVTKTIYQGLVSAPAASPNGRYILFSESGENNQIGLNIYDRQTQKLKAATAFDMPGISGYSYFSRDGEYLYFNHYLNDTDGDQKINANDHSVVFRVPFKKWLDSTERFLPEQLTSVEYNCKFPALSKQFLYVTCAFKGSLDVYRLPVSGSVPEHWDEKALTEAHLAARSYEERLLLLNAMRYRFKQNSTEMLERILSDHLNLHEYTASSYFVASLAQQYQSNNNEKMSAFYQALAVLLEVRAAKRNVAEGIVTARYKRMVENKRLAMNSIKSWPSLSNLINAYMEYELEHEGQALMYLDQVNLSGKLLPLERYLAFELYQRILESSNPQRLLTLYPVMFNHADMPLEAKLFSAINYLKLLSQLENENRRISLLQSQTKQTADARLAELFNAEILSLQISQSDDDKQQIKLYKSLAKLLKNNKTDLLVRKALHTRAIQILGENEQFKYMELLSRHWLVTTHVSEMEFVNVAEQYSVITMDKAYGMMADGELANAFNTFYSAIRQTNELEAHYQYLLLGLNPALNNLENMRKAYALLEKQNLLGVAKIYVEALEKLLELEAKEDIKAAAYDDSLKKLQVMPLGKINPAMRELLMAYIYHKQLRLTQEGYSYNKSMYKKAHHHYMLAMDYAIGNTRIAATVWENIGWLHFDVRQYALAASFFQRRLQLAFKNEDSRLNVLWIYARALFYNNQMDEASEQAEQALTLAQQANVPYVQPYREKAAFYAMQAGSYDRAINHYKTLFDDPQKLTDTNRSKALLSLAYSLYQSGNNSAAQQQLTELLKLVDQLEVLPANNERLIAFHPQRLRLLALGLLSKLVPSVEKKAEYLQARIKMLEDMPSSKKNFAYDEASRLSFLSKDQQHLSLLFETMKKPQAMMSAMSSSLKTAELWAEETGLKTGPVIYQVLLNSLSLGIAHSTVLDEKQTKALQAAYQHVQDEIAKQTFKTTFSVTQQIKLEILWTVLQSKRQNLKQDDLSEALKKILSSPDLLLVKQEQVLEYQALLDLIDYFLTEGV